MRPIEIVVLAVMATAETDQTPWLAAKYVDDIRINNLLAEGLIEVRGETLIITPAGWQLLDGQLFEV